MKTEPTEAYEAVQYYEANNINIDAFRAKKLFDVAFYEGQSSPNIKRLEWAHPVTRRNNTGTEYAYTPFGKYWINNWRTAYNKDVVWLLFDRYTGTIPNGGREDVGMYDTVEEAKAAAQPDFEKKVMECLDL